MIPPTQYRAARTALSVSIRQLGRSPEASREGFNRPATMSSHGCSARRGRWAFQDSLSVQSTARRVNVTNLRPTRG